MVLLSKHFHHIFIVVFPFFFFFLKIVSNEICSTDVLFLLLKLFEQQSFNVFLEVKRKKCKRSPVYWTIFFFQVLISFSICVFLAALCCSCSYFVYQCNYTDTNAYVCPWTRRCIRLEPIALSGRDRYIKCRMHNSFHTKNCPGD